MSHARLEENTDKPPPLPLEAPPAPRSHSTHLRSLYIGTFQTTLLLAPPPRPRFRAPGTRQRIHQSPPPLLSIAAPSPR